MICKRLKILHISICRNACVSIRKAFKKKFSGYEFINKHHSVGDIGEPVSEKILKTYRSFCVVRNPFDRMVSIWLWGYRTRGWRNKTFKEFLINIYSGKYKERIKRYSAVSGLSNSWIYSPQIKWITDVSGKIRVNKILWFENLDADFKQLCKDWDLPMLPLKKTNTAKSRCGFERKHWKYYYDDEDLDIVRKLFKEDFKIFNYEINNP